MLKTITVFKFIYLYISYWLVGLAEEDFFISKANYFADLGKYHSAIKYYKKAIKEDELYSIYGAIGWCYAALEQYQLSLENYRKAFERIKRHEVTVILAHLEMEYGDSEKCKMVFESIKEERKELPGESQKFYDEVKIFLDRQILAN